MNAHLRSNVSLPRQALAAFCRRNGIRRLAIFGSALRGDFRPDSDVDVLASIADLENDDMRVRAIVQALGVIGEAASRVSEDLRAEHPDIPWAAIVGMRNRLVHAYFDIDHERVHDTVVEDVPRLVARVTAILHHDPDDREDG